MVMYLIRVCHSFALWRCSPAACIEKKNLPINELLVIGQLGNCFRVTRSTYFTRFVCLQPKLITCLKFGHYNWNLSDNFRQPLVKFLGFCNIRLFDFCICLLCPSENALLATIVGVTDEVALFRFTLTEAVMLREVQWIESWSESSQIT